MKLLDSTFLTHHARGTEVGVGLRGLGERFRELVTEITEVPFGPDEARTSLEIQRELYDRGEAIGAVDVLISGTVANRPDPTVMTRNVDAFERVDAIDVVSY